ncbi:MAG TPA: A24 family peptidase [Steroidobacteraceae bacterium]|nr:A24 family peptidase [Steroidobacteraceae bacterium]
MELFDTFAASPGLFIGCCVALGLLIGSFLNVVIYRVPMMMDNELRAECAALAGSEPVTAPVFNIVTPRSACPACKAPITALQNVPVVSWLALRGRCANCKARISARYPAVELATGLLSGFIAWHFGFGGLALAALALTWFLIALTLIDFDTQYLPDQLTYPLLWLGLIVSLWHPAWAAGAEPVGPRESIIGAVAGYLSLWSVYWAFKLLTGKEGMGYGDFKLFAALGAWLGWQMLLPIIVFASGVGAMFGVYVMIRQRKGKDMQLAFGPFLAIAGWLALVAGHAVVSRYFALFATNT